MNLVGTAFSHIQVKRPKTMCRSAEMVADSKVDGCVRAGALYMMAGAYNVE